MISYRNFLNTDPPAIIEIWQNQPNSRAFSQVITRRMLDQMVLAKPYFDPAGMILAFEGEKPVGFIHLGFAPNERMDGIDCENGILAQIRVIQTDKAIEIAKGLWEQGRKYFAERQTKRCYAGGKFPYSPFYYGLYGGSRIPGIPDDDSRTIEFLRELGFEESGRVNVMQVNLVGFRPPISRSQMTVRRQYQVSSIVDPLLPNWWECCTFGWAELYGFRIVRRSDQEVVGSVMFWDIQPLSSQWGRPTMGLVDLVIEEELRNQGLATYLVGESLRQLSSQGIASAEVQMNMKDHAAIALAEKLGFEKVAEGTEMLILLDTAKQR